MMTLKTFYMIKTMYNVAGVIRFFKLEAQTENYQNNIKMLILIRPMTCEGISKITPHWSLLLTSTTLCEQMAQVTPGDTLANRDSRALRKLLSK